MNMGPNSFEMRVAESDARGHHELEHSWTTMILEDLCRLEHMRRPSVYIWCDCL